MKDQEEELDEQAGTIQQLEQVADNLIGKASRLYIIIMPLTDLILQIHMTMTTSSLVTLYINLYLFLY